MWSVALALLQPISAQEILPWAAPWDVQEQLDRHQASRGEAKVELACEALWPEAVRLCFRELDQGRLVRVAAADLPVDLARRSATRDGAKWVEEELETAPIAGMEGSYRLLRDAAGRAALGALLPEAVAAELGSPFLAALPSSSMFVAWKAGEPEIDRVMAVAVREIHDGAKDRVSPVVFGWDGQRWFAFVEAKPAAAAP